MTIDSFTGKYLFLSNFYPVVIDAPDGLNYNSVEHAYQAAKTASREEKEKIRRAKTAGEAKRLGRHVTLRADWEQVKIATMRVLLQRKFAYTSMADKLLATGNEELVEGNWWGDKYWGVCNGVGENHLGKLLMEVRTTLRPVDV